MVEANEEVRVRTSIEEFLALINNHLSGLKKGKTTSHADHYREEIARIVVKDFDTPKEDIKNAIRRLRYPMPFTTIDEKSYNCLRSDLQKAIVVEFSHKREGIESKQEQMSRPVSVPYSQGDINLHENRDRLKRSFQWLTVPHWNEPYIIYLRTLIYLQIWINIVELVAIPGVVSRSFAYC